MDKWLNKFPVADPKHIPELERDAALNEFHHKQARGIAEHKAYSDYRKKQHTEAAVHHFVGSEDAKALGNKDAYKNHATHLYLHLKALGDPVESLAEVKALALEKPRGQSHKFEGHSNDGLLEDALMTKSEAVAYLGSALVESLKHSK